MTIFDEQEADVICHICNLNYDQNTNIKFHTRNKSYYGRMKYLCDKCFNDVKYSRTTQLINNGKYMNSHGRKQFHRQDYISKNSRESKV